MNDSKPSAIVLLSGGLDSATVLAIAQQTHVCTALSFDYGQRHIAELNAAMRLAQEASVEHTILKMDKVMFAGSALTDEAIAVPTQGGDEIPVTYVPARNTVFLSHALALAEVREATAIFIGVNAVDYSGYPDCRPEYIEAFENMARLATRAGIEGRSLSIETPLIEMSKAEIIRTGAALGVDYAETVSCYQADADGRACGECDSCRFRAQGFEEAGIEDPTRYR